MNRLQDKTCLVTAAGQGIGRAAAIAMFQEGAHVIATDIFPLQNLSTRRKLGSDFGADEAAQARWSRDVTATGFAALETETAARGWSPSQGRQIRSHPWVRPAPRP